MSRKSAAGPEKLSASQLKTIRSQIDRLDQQLVKAMNERAGLALRIGRVKAESGETIFSASREEEVIANVLARNKGPLADATLRAIFRELISGSRALQRSLKVAYLGPDFSFSHLAALERFGESVDYMKVGSVSAVFEEVSRRHVDYGVVPLENSTDGRIADTLDMFLRTPDIRICSEVRLLIHHNLLANCEQPDIRRVYSKSQALSQCRNWLAKNLPHASLHEVSSTADAARLVQGEQNSAAIASRQAALRYGVRVLFENIEDIPGNETRFAVISMADGSRTGNDKTAIIFETENTSKGLASVLNVFKLNKINLTWIESFPQRPENDNFVFFAEFEGHHDDAKPKKTLKAMERYCERVQMLGSYPAAAAAE